jgi:glutamate-5-semialdehyde dehydrogenase
MTYMDQLGQNAIKAKEILSVLSTDKKNAALKQMASDLLENVERILAANMTDVENARQKGIKETLVDRLSLSKKRMEAMAQGILDCASFPDPIGEVLEEKTLENGLKLKKVRVPMGVIGIIYESRPNVTTDAAALCFKAGSATILKGGSDAINTNKAIMETIKRSLIKSNLPEGCIQLVEDTGRETVLQMMKANEYIDLLIPRGGAELIASVVKNATVPVIETGTGNCHVYIDSRYNEKYAKDITVNAKCSRPGVCNAIETLLVHKDVYKKVLPVIWEGLKEYNVLIKGDERTREILHSAVPASEEDWATEYLDFILAIKVVDSIDEAIRHINKYGTKHSECIVTDIEGNKDRFRNEIDAACVYVNASTRFTDGGVFGSGAEIGISTQKLHARGPMGAREITTYKYIIDGEGQIR